MRYLISCIVLCMGLAYAADPNVEYLSDMVADGAVQHEQQWGKLGIDTAAYSTGPPKPIRIGENTFKKGLGHHANGRITVPLTGVYLAFRATIGVQWQEGKRGSVRFRVLVDGKKVFEHGPVSGNDPPRAIDIPLTGARDLCLIADDNGDGIACDMANWGDAYLVRDHMMRIPSFGATAVTLCGKPAPAPSSECAGGVALVAESTGPQILLMGIPVSRLMASLRENESVCLNVPMKCAGGALQVAADFVLRTGDSAEVAVGIGEKISHRVLEPSRIVTLEVQSDVAGGGTIALTMRSTGNEAGVRLERLRYQADGRGWFDAPLRFRRPPSDVLPPPRMPEFRPGIAQELIEWDWRMHDGIGTPKERVSWKEAVGEVLACGDRLVRDLQKREVPLGDMLCEWEDCHVRAKALAANSATGEREWEQLWLRVHTVRRRIVFADPTVAQDPILFVKQVPSQFSHQLTQYSGLSARPGGGVFVLDAPGKDMRCHELARGMLPVGSYQRPELSYDGCRLLFSYCRLDPARRKMIEGREQNADTYYHLYEISTDGNGLRQITKGPFDDFSPTFLPDGRIMFISTRRGGFHRCGRGPCPVYTLAKVNPDGSGLRVLSCHETHEWDPAVLNDGRVIYTRWDYVDRNAVYYQQLWTTHPDGAAPSEYFGSYMRNPVGIWEARPIPESQRIMATAAAHHAMTAGSIIRIDVNEGRDTMDAITRLTPDVPFPESESTVRRSKESAEGWRGMAGVTEQRPVPRAEKRWPGHCYRSPYPLSETTFLAAYSYDPLIGEPSANAPNTFGIYVVDCFGNRELLYRDPNISSLWPIPIRPRRRPPTVASAAEEPGQATGTFVLHDVGLSAPVLPADEGSRIRRLRIVQVLPKTTPHANTPRVGWANASPGKQVLGTVPVEPDGSAYFRAPANTPLLFQALDSQGRSVQSMRSLTYLQRGETASCIGCHEPRSSAPPRRRALMALTRAPSEITPGPDGTKPLSYPLLVQPVLDRHCVKCHSGEKPTGGVSLTAKPEKDFTESYNQLAKRVSYSSWGREDNSEPLSKPDYFGARGSMLMKHLSSGHKDVRLGEDEWNRLITWMDTTALFYGTFNRDDQVRQRRGERIQGPDLE
ncbi:MAG: NPCBM/NEW2 domain-containing protein [Planctomycetota bacterium]